MQERVRVTAKDDIYFYINEDRQSVWGKEINKALERIDPEYRFRSISLTEFGPVVARGIWTIPQAKEIFENTKKLGSCVNNEPINDGNSMTFGFTCNVDIISKLIEEKTFVENGINGQFMLLIPTVTQEKNPPKVEILLSSDKVRAIKKEVFVQFSISNS